MFAQVVAIGLFATMALAQGEGLGYPPPPAQTLTHTMSGVLPVLPPGFTGVAVEEGAIIYDGPSNTSFMPVYGPATTASNLPAATYQALLPSTNFDNGTGSTVIGNITISSSPGTPGVMVSVDFSGFPSEELYGPFVYHIHTLPVPSNGNCTATMGHLDPTDRGEYYPCNAAAPDTCQVGDLSGKHGNITASPFKSNYTDQFLSTNLNSSAFFGDLSVVIHTENTTRITCANFTLVESSNSANASSTSNTTSPTGAATGTATASGGRTSMTGTATSATSSTYTAAATQLAGYGVVGLIGAAAAFML
ncbi:Cell surface superoxide dismutase [Teratosphaeria destructans]|uniref:superoxide dismutase n=1 Tax=Teratosphaeria destructans TaxID=418781 RepID=A0A9W7SWP9_9PEZI|nr:Cell surface superoxide dismutase [Teratosphaeria destructans]